MIARTIFVGCTFALVLAAKLIEVGPAHKYRELVEVPWGDLSAGDTVNIHHRPQPYAAKILISSRGSAQKPIRITGILGPKGERPVIQGSNAKTGNNIHYRWTHVDHQESLGLVQIGYARGGSKPGYIEIANLEITGARPENSFVGADGRTHPFSRHAAGLRIHGADHVRMTNLRIHDCDNGIFSKSQNEEQFVTRGLIIENSEIFGNGRGGGYSTVHNIYTEADGVLIQGNHFGVLVPGSAGAIIKDRSAGTVIRYNWIPDAARMLDLVEPEDGWPLLNASPTFGETFVYGNIFCSRTGDSVGTTRAIHYGGDRGTGNERKGTLYFYHNTFVTIADEAERWKVKLFDVTNRDAVIDIRNNIFATLSRTGAGRAELDFSTQTGKFVFGRNWVSPGWRMRFSGEGPFEGTATGDKNFVVSANNEVKFAGVSAGDFRPSKQWTAIRAAGELAPAVTTNSYKQDFRVTSQYEAKGATTPRDAGQDGELGALSSSK